MFKKSKEPSNLTRYDWKLLSALIFCSMSLSILSTSLFGLYYLERYTKFQDYLKLNEKRYAVLKEILKDYDSELRLRGMEWDYATKHGIGAEVVPNKEVNKKSK